MFDEYSQQKLSRMGKRRFMKALAGLGVSGTTLGAASQGAMADVLDDPKKEVPRVLGYVHTNPEEVAEGAVPEREPEYYTISRDQWVRVESASHAREQIEKQVKNELDHSSRTVVSTDNNGDKVIVVKVRENQSGESERRRKIEQVVPYQIDGVAGEGSDFEEKVQDIPVEIQYKTDIQDGSSQGDIDTDSTALVNRQMAFDFTVSRLA